MHSLVVEHSILPFPTPPQSMRLPPLRVCVEEALADYFDHLDGQAPQDLYAFVLNEVEVPLLRTVLEHTQHNQSRAAQLLGISRSTLRKKLKQYGIA